MKKSCKIVSILAAAVITVSAMCIPAGATYYGENLLTNPDASNGTKGWKDPDNEWDTVDSYKDISSYDGKFFMPKELKRKEWETFCIYQDIPLKNCAGKKGQVRGHLCTADGKKSDNLIVKVEYFDSQGKVIASNAASTSWCDNWGTFTAWGDIPDKAVKARVSMIVEYRSGDFADGGFDDISYIIDGVKRSDLITDKSTRKKRSYLIKKGDTIRIDDVFLKAGKGKIKWSTSDKNIVTVDGAGNITGMKRGIAVITAKKGKEAVKIKIEVD